jgi:hypothetical protein
MLIARARLIRALGVFYRGYADAKEKPMNDINDVRSKANDYGRLFALLAIAHEQSAEWHRGLGEKLGGAEKALSTIVGTAIFVAVASQLGLNGKGTISVPEHTWAKAIYFLVLVLLMLAPAMTALQIFFKHQEQSVQHRESFAAYGRLEQRIDLLLLTYSSEADREKALIELDLISKELQSVRRNSITLTKKAYKEAEIERRRRECVAHATPNNSFNRSAG